MSSDGQCLSIVAWNDMHGTLVPDESVVDTGRVPVGGVVALADQVDAIRRTGDTVVVLDAGDLFTGPLESTLAEGAPIIDAYRVIGVDAAAIGNHEFDFGPVGYEKVVAQPGAADDANGPRGALQARMESAPFPFVAANIEAKDKHALNWPKFKPSVRIERNGFSVGVVGYTTKETPTTTLKPNVDDLEFALGATARVGDEIRKLRAAGAFPVVLLAHASLEGELPQVLDDPKDPQGNSRVGEIASLLDSLGADKPDLVVAGHRHAWLLGRVRGVPIVSSSQHGVGLTRIRYCAPKGAKASFAALAKLAKLATLTTIERHVAMSTTPPISQLGRDVQKAIDPWLSKVKSQADAEVTTLTKTCLPQGLNGTAFGEQVARAVMLHVGDAAPPPKDVPVVAVVNSGGLRAPLLPGPLRYSELFAAFPFENAVAACGTTLGGLKKVLANSINKASVTERFPFGIAGAHVTLLRIEGGRLAIDSVEIDGAKEKLSDDAPIWLAIPDFLLWGGDGMMNGITCTKSATSSTRVRDAWRELLAKEGGGCDGAPKTITVK